MTTGDQRPGGRLELKPAGAERSRPGRVGFPAARTKPVTVEVRRRRRSASSSSARDSDGNQPQMDGNLSNVEKVRRLEALELAKRTRREATSAAERHEGDADTVPLGTDVLQGERQQRTESRQATEAGAAAAQSQPKPQPKLGQTRADGASATGAGAAATVPPGGARAETSSAAVPVGARPAPIPVTTAAPAPRRPALGEVVMAEAPRGPMEIAPPMPTPRQRIQPDSVRKPARTDEARTSGAPEPEREGKATPRKGAKPSEFEDRRVRSRSEPKRRQTRLSLHNLADGDDAEGGTRQRSMAALRRQRERERQQNLKNLSAAGKVVRDVTIPETILVSDFANRMAEPTSVVIKALMKMGVMATAGQAIDGDTAELIATEFGHRIKRVAESDVEDALDLAEDSEAEKMPRPPIVTVMGHVDHGKTSLLDYLRKSRVADSEAGGITQHVAAYRVKTGEDRWATFVDTPGHAAFAQIRSRGAKATDIIVLVVAATDGVQEQTIEAIRHAKAADVPIIVAINKMDAPGADADKIPSQLAQHEVFLEAMGGDVLSARISAKAGTNIDQLLECIELQAELLGLKANPNRAAEGVLVEVRQERGKGVVATLLIERGTIHKGNNFVVGSETGKVRMLYDDAGKNIASAGPSEPIEVQGFDGVPMAGDRLVVLKDEAHAREIAAYRARKVRDTAQIARTGDGSWDELFAKLKEGKVNELPILIKADTHGSLEAVCQSLEAIDIAGVQTRIISGGVGGINESDIQLGSTGQGLVVGFNVRANPKARDMARANGVDMRYYRIIYELIDDVRALLEGSRPPEERERILGYAEIRQIFDIGKNRKAGGCMVTEGTIQRGAQVRLIRDDVVVHEGELSMLRRFREDVREVKNATECGVSFQSFHDLKDGDRVECFLLEMVKPEATKATGAGSRGSSNQAAR